MPERPETRVLTAHKRTPAQTEYHQEAQHYLTARAEPGVC